MNTYKVKLEIDAEILAFSEEDAREYITDIYGLDEEILRIKVVSIKEK